MHRWFQTAFDYLHPARCVTRIQRPAETQRAVNQAVEHLVLYHFSSCPYCLRVRRAAHWLNIPLALRDIHIDAVARAALVAGGGRQTVPCLYIDDDVQGTWLYESADIVRYLDRRFAPVGNTP